MNILAPKRTEDKSTERPVMIALPSDWPCKPTHAAGDRMLFWLALVRMVLETVIRLATISADSKPLRLLILVGGGAASPHQRGWRSAADRRHRPGADRAVGGGGRGTGRGEEDPGPLAVAGGIGVWVFIARRGF